jgi:hypothetical protein
MAIEEGFADQIRVAELTVEKIFARFIQISNEMAVIDEHNGIADTVEYRLVGLYVHHILLPTSYDHLNTLNFDPLIRRLSSLTSAFTGIRPKDLPIPDTTYNPIVRHPIDEFPGTPAHYQNGANM